MLLLKQLSSIEKYWFSNKIKIKILFVVDDNITIRRYIVTNLRIYDTIGTKSK